MSNLQELIQRYTVKYDRKIKQICAPLKEQLGIPIFTYYEIDENGRIATLSTCPEQLEFYYSEQLYRENAYMSHPDTLRSGLAVTPAIGDSTKQEQSRQKFQIDHLLVKLEKTGNSVEGFNFGTPALSEDRGQARLLNNLELLNRFPRYFKNQARSLIQKMKQEGFNLRQAKGEAFSQVNPNCLLSIANPQKIQFLKSIFPLTVREWECLELYKKGHSAQATGAILGISQRTVEYYFDNIKHKLGCLSKSELLEW